MTVLRLVAAGLIMMAAAAAAQTLPSAKDIIVNGRRPIDPKAAESYVASIAVRSDTQLARFHQPLCTAVIGIAKPYSTIIQKRIEVDAIAAGVEVSKKTKCETNFLVVLAGDGAALVKDIRAHRPGWLNGLAPRDVDALIAPKTARAWSVTSLRNEDGFGEGQMEDAPGGNNLSGVPTLQVMSASIVHQPTRQDVEGSFVVIDRDATIGMTLRQISDYAAMRGLARTRPPAPGSNGVATILSLFDDPPAHRAPQMTDADSAYLRALYRSPGTDSALREKNAIARRIAKGK